MLFIYLGLTPFPLFSKSVRLFFDPFPLQLLFAAELEISRFHIVYFLIFHDQFLILASFFLRFLISFFLSFFILLPYHFCLLRFVFFFFKIHSRPTASCCIYSKTNTHLFPVFFTSSYSVSADVPVTSVHVSFCPPLFFPSVLSCPLVSDVWLCVVYARNGAVRITHAAPTRCQLAMVRV